VLALAQPGVLALDPDHGSVEVLLAVVSQPFLQLIVYMGDRELELARYDACMAGDTMLWAP